MLDNLFIRAIFKIFKVSEKDVIHDIRNFIGLHHVEQLCVKRREKFLSKTRLLTHAVLHTLTGQSSVEWILLLVVVVNCMTCVGFFSFFFLSRF